MIPNTEQIRDLLESWLGSRLDAVSVAWVRGRQEVIRSGDKKGLYVAFGMTPRRVGKLDLSLTADELSAANAARHGWNPRGWSIDQAVRTLFLISRPSQEPATLVATLDQLFAAGEVGELVDYVAPENVSGIGC